MISPESKAHLHREEGHVVIFRELKTIGVNADGRPRESLPYRGRIFSAFEIFGFRVGLIRLRCAEAGR